MADPEAVKAVEKLEPRPVGRMSQIVRKKKVSFMFYEEIRENEPPTGYAATLMNLFKGNVGTGCYAMAEAFMNGGIIVGPILTLIIAVICIHTMHLLSKCSSYVKDQQRLAQRPDYAETVEMSFSSSKSEKWQRTAKAMKTICNVFICITQLGFCSVYFLFIAENVKNVLDYYGFEIEIHFMIVIVLVPVWLTALVRKLKYIAIFSTCANVFSIVGIVLTIGYASQNLPKFSTRTYAKLETLPIYFGTALFAFEGIALVLPLQNAMKDPESFSRPLGVLNVGMVLVSSIYILVGLIGFWQYGEETEASLTLNLPVNEILGQVIKIMISVGVLLGYAIQFFVAIQIMFSDLQGRKFVKKYIEKYPRFTERIFRSLMVLVTFVVAALVPNLSVLLSLLGSVCCVVLVFVFPVLCEMMILSAQDSGIGAWNWFKNGIILIIAAAGFIAGGVLGLKQVYDVVTSDFH